MISVVALDIDGVLTDGLVRIDEDGRESKTLSYLDIDAIYAARSAGLRVVLVTGEDTALVAPIARRLDIADVFRGEKDKQAALRRIAADLGVALSELCYVGDAARDAPALAAVGLGLAPSDAAPAARASAHRVLTAPGGRGAVSEALELVLSMRD
jgi:YrbI family 3-deoxy-D-manno-octulosonate 8-phosphate phosphatase